MFSTVVPVTLQFHSIEPAWVTGEKTKCLPKMCELVGAPLLNVTSITPSPAAPATSTDATYLPTIEVFAAKPNEAFEVALNEL